MGYTLINYTEIYSIYVSIGRLNYYCFEIILSRGLKSCPNSSYSSKQAIKTISLSLSVNSLASACPENEEFVFLYSLQVEGSLDL